MQSVLTVLKSSSVASVDVATLHLETCNSAFLSEKDLSSLYERLMYTILDRQHGRLVLDMSHFESLDSNGLMTLVPALTLAQKLKQEVVFCGVASSIRLVFELTQLDQIFEIVHDVLMPNERTAMIPE